jgi:predicted transcriptional regulator
MVKTTKEQIEEMKRLRTEGLLFKEIAEKLGVGIDRVSYYLNPRVKSRKIREGIENSKANKERWRGYNKKWRKKNPEKYKKSVFFSTMRGYLKRGIITKQEVLDTVNNYTLK